MTWQTNTNYISSSPSSLSPHLGGCLVIIFLLDPGLFLSAQVLFWFWVDLKEEKWIFVFWCCSLSTSKLHSVLSLFLFFSALRSLSLLLFSGGAWLTPLSLCLDFLVFPDRILSTSYSVASTGNIFVDVTNTRFSLNPQPEVSTGGGDSFWTYGAPVNSIRDLKAGHAHHVNHNHGW